MKSALITMALAGAALLAGCSAPESEADKRMAEPTASPDEPVSILRPDVEQPEPEQEPVQPETLMTVIGFPEGGAELDSSAIAALRGVLKSEQMKTGGPIVLRGHSDAGGNDAVNQRASQERAEAVRDWLTDQGVDEKRISIIAFGEQNPVKPNALPDGEPNEAGRAANRRVEIEIPLLPLDQGFLPPSRQSGSAETGD